MAIGNEFAKGFQYLEHLFGERNFRVRNMDDNTHYMAAGT